MDKNPNSNSILLFNVDELYEIFCFLQRRQLAQIELVCAHFHWIVQQSALRHKPFLVIRKCFIKVNGPSRPLKRSTRHFCGSKKKPRHFDYLDIWPLAEGKNSICISWSRIAKFELPKYLRFSSVTYNDWSLSGKEEVRADWKKLAFLPRIRHTFGGACICISIAHYAFFDLFPMAISNSNQKVKNAAKNAKIIRPRARLEMQLATIFSDCRDFLFFIDDDDEPELPLSAPIAFVLLKNEIILRATELRFVHNGLRGETFNQFEIFASEDLINWLHFQSNKNGGVDKSASADEEKSIILPSNLLDLTQTQEKLMDFTRNLFHRFQIAQKKNPYKLEIVRPQEIPENLPLFARNERTNEKLYATTSRNQEKGGEFILQFIRTNMQIQRE